MTLAQILLAIWLVLLGLVWLLVLHISGTLLGGLALMAGAFMLLEGCSGSPIFIIRERK